VPQATCFIMLMPPHGPRRPQSTPPGRKPPRRFESSGGLSKGAPAKTGVAHGCVAVPRLRPASASSNRGPIRNARHELGWWRGDWGVPSEPVATFPALGAAGFRTLQCPRTGPFFEPDCWTSSPEAPPHSAPQLFNDSSVPSLGWGLRAKEPRAMVNDAVKQFRHDAAALVQSFLSFSEAPVVTGNLSVSLNEVEHHISSSTLPTSTETTSKNTSFCSMQCTSASGERHAELQSSGNLHLKDKRISTNIDDRHPISALTVVSDTHVADSKEHAEPSLRGDLKVEHSMTNSEVAQLHGAPAVTEGITAHGEGCMDTRTLGDLYPELVCPATGADNSLLDGVPNFPINNEGVAHTDGTMDDVTRHLMHARDKIEAVEHEFTQIMAELANYGKRFAAAADPDAAERKSPEYFCIDTPTPRRKEGSSFPPSSARSLTTEPIASMPFLER